MVPSQREFDQFVEVAANAVRLQLHALPYDLGDNRHKGPHDLVRLAKRIANIVTAKFRMEETRTSGVEIYVRFRWPFLFRQPRPNLPVSGVLTLVRSLLEN